ncbi:multicopper oxidase domain-containing protein [Amycolatopsis methanolica]|uniref:multicopper oxidase domain-containing protein n=1 Tax=Amycolatopsis methanolica TaxID=1814 RepID=UPI0034445025
MVRPLHSRLPETEVWTYEGQFPGPTVEVPSGKKLRVNWSNDIDGTTRWSPSSSTPNSPTSPRRFAHLAGETRTAHRSPAPRSSTACPLPAWTVVHLHGARTGHHRPPPGHRSGHRRADRAAAVQDPVHHARRPRRGPRCRSRSPGRSRWSTGSSGRTSPSTRAGTASGC